MVYPNFFLIFLFMERRKNEAISHRLYPRDRRRLAIARNTQGINVLSGGALSVLQVRLRCYVKCNESYETIGGLFAEILKNSVEFSVAERIWLLIVEVINVIVEVLNCDAMVLTEQIISNDKQIKSKQ